MRSGAFDRHALLNAMRLTVYDEGSGHPVGRSRGAAVQSTRQFMIEKYGEPGFERLLQKLDPELRDLLIRPLAISWQDAPAMNRIYEVIQSEFGDGTDAIFHEIGCFSARHDVKAYFKFLLTLASPAQIIQRLPMMWGTYYDTGQMQVNVNGNRADAEIAGFEDAGIPCKLASGFVEEVLRMGGARNPKVIHTECVANNHEKCRFVVTWDN